MPAEGAQILAQVEALLQQFLALKYDTPVKDQAQQWLAEVQDGVSQLKGEAGVSNPTDAGGEEILGEAESAAEDVGEPQPELPVGGEAPGDKPSPFDTTDHTKGKLPSDGFKAATAQVKQDMGKGGLSNLKRAKGSKKKPQPA